jgi:hypothetical protein
MCSNPSVFCYVIIIGYFVLIGLRRLLFCYKSLLYKEQKESLVEELRLRVIYCRVSWSEEKQKLQTNFPEIEKRNERNETN